MLREEASLTLACNYLTIDCKGVNLLVHAVRFHLALQLSNSGELSW